MPRKRSAVARTDPTNRPLTSREKRLVELLVAAASEGRDLSRQELGEAAGYGSGESARVQTYRALARPRVRAAIIAALRDAAQADAPGAYGVLRHVARTARSTRDRVTAASRLLEVAGVVGGDRVATGPAVMVQIAFRTDAAELLRRPPEAVVPGVLPSQPIPPADAVASRRDPWADELAREAEARAEEVRAGRLVPLEKIEAARQEQQRERTGSRRRR